MSTERTHFYAQEERTVAVSMSPPTARVVVIDAWCEPDGEVKHTIHAVVALCREAVDIYEKMYWANEDRPNSQLSAEQLLEDGWIFSRQENTLSAIYVADGRLCSSDDVRGNQHLFLATCDWPEDEDEVRLEHKIKKAKYFVTPESDHTSK